MNRTSYDVAIVGGGPNGLTAAAVLSRSGLSVLVLERNERIGGSCRTEPLTLPGFAHDVCAAIHPTAVVSPIFSRLDLERFGLEWVAAPRPLAHPLDNGRCALLSRSLAETALGLGADGETWRGIFDPLVARRDEFFRAVLRPIRWPQPVTLMARFGRLALQSAARVAHRFATEEARALFAGIAAHSFLPLTAPGSAAFGLVLGTAAHAVDWPCARGGSATIVEALAACARAAGCEIVTSCEIRSLGDVPPARAVLFDLTPRQVLAIAGGALSSSYRRRLATFAYGPGAFKIDYALSAPVPWRSSECQNAATVHVGGTFDEIARSESDAAGGRICEAPFVLMAQQSHVDGSRAPLGQHTGWAYCHLPHGSTVDMTGRIERQIERFAPGFRDVILARHVMPPRALEEHNPNLVGGDIGGGANTLAQFVFRPTARWNPYATSNPRLFLCSSSTPPGGGVHGMCGYWCASAVLRSVFRLSVPAPLVV